MIITPAALYRFPLKIGGVGVWEFYHVRLYKSRLRLSMPQALVTWVAVY